MLTVVLATPVHDPILPVTVYTVVSDGFVTCDPPEKLLLQTYWLAPLAVSITDPDAQMEVELATAFTGNGAPSVTLTVFTWVQDAFEPVTVSTEFEEGVTTIIDPEALVLQE
jgi:hypothetical protein